MLFVNFSRKVQTFPATDYKIERNKKNFSKAALTELNAFHLGAYYEELRRDTYIFVIVTNKSGYSKKKILQPCRFIFRILF